MSTAYESALLSLGPDAAWFLQEADPGPATNLVNDQFTGTNGTRLSSHTADSGDTWTRHPATTSQTAQIEANRIRASGAGQAVYYTSEVPASSAYVLEARVRCIANTSGTQAGLVARCSTTSPLVGYRALYLGGFNTWYLYKDVGGTSTQLGTWAETLNGGDQRIVQLKVQDDTVSVLIDGALRISVTDNSISAAGRGAVEVNGGSATDGFHIDYFQYRQLKATFIIDGTGNGHYGAIWGEFTLGVDGLAAGEGAAMITPVPEKGGWGCIPSYTPFASGSNRTFVGIVRHRPPHPNVRSPQVWFGGAGLSSDSRTNLPLLEAVYEGDDGGFTRVHWISELQIQTFYGATIWYHVLPIDEWIHYALTVVDNGTLQTAELFLNGVSKGTGVSVPNQPTWHANSGIYLIGNRGQGSGQLATGHSTDGWLGCQAVFNRILSSSEIGGLASVFG